MNAWEDTGDFFEDVWDDVEDVVIEPIGEWFENAGQEIADWAHANGIVDFFERTGELFEALGDIVEDWADDVGLTAAFEEAGQWIEGAWYDAGAWI